jgi:hypothetical protein
MSIQWGISRDGVDLRHLFQDDASITESSTFAESDQDSARNTLAHFLQDFIILRYWKCEHGLSWTKLTGHTHVNAIKETVLETFGADHPDEKFANSWSGIWDSYVSLCFWKLIRVECNMEHA